MTVSPESRVLVEAGPVAEPISQPLAGSGGKLDARLGGGLLALLVAISALGPLALNGVLPAATTVMAEFAASYGATQLKLTVFMVAILLAQLLIGQAADRYGRRPVMVSCLVLFTVGSSLCAIAPSLEWLLVARFVQGVGAAACMVLPRTIVRDVHPRDKAASVIGYMTTAMMIAPLFGPAIGGWITTHGDWRMMYTGLAILGALVALLAVVAQRETRVPVSAAVLNTRSTSLFAGARSLFKEPAFVATVVLFAGSVGTYFTFLAGAPGVAMQSLGMAPSEYGRWFALVGVGYLTGNLVAGHFSSRVGSLGMIRLGLLPLSAGLILFWLLHGVSHPVALFLPMQLCAFSNGMSLPNLLSTIMSVKPSHAGTASGLAGTVQMGVGVVLTLLIGQLLPFGDIWLVTLMSFCGAMAAIGAYMKYKTDSALPAVDLDDLSGDVPGQGR